MNEYCAIAMQVDGKTNITTTQMLGDANRRLIVL